MGALVSDPVSQIIGELLEYGALGVLVVVLLVAWNRENKRQDKRDEMNARALKELADALRANTEALTQLASRIEALKGFIEAKLK